MLATSLNIFLLTNTMWPMQNLQQPHSMSLSPPTLCSWCPLIEGPFWESDTTAFLLYSSIIPFSYWNLGLALMWLAGQGAKHGTTGRRGSLGVQLQLCDLRQVALSIWSAFLHIYKWRLWDQTISFPSSSSIVWPIIFRMWGKKRKENSHSGDAKFISIWRIRERSKEEMILREP